MENNQNLVEFSIKNKVSRLKILQKRLNKASYPQRRANVLPVGLCT